MNKKFLLAIPISVLAVACAPMPPADDGECSVVNVPEACTGSASNPKLGITLVRNGIRVGPPNLCADADTTITVSVHPRQSETGTVEIVPKNPAHTWLNASNDTDPNSFTIKVPADVDKDADYDYTIIRSNGVCLDPRIRVPPA